MKNKTFNGFDYFIIQIDLKLKGISVKIDFFRYDTIQVNGRFILNIST